MKICLLSCFDDLMKRDTGSSIRIYNLAKGLVNLGHNVSIIIPGNKDCCKNVDGISIYEIKGFFPEKLLHFLSHSLGILRSRSLYVYDPIFIGKALSVMFTSHIIQIEQPWTGGILIPSLMRIMRKTFVVDSHDVFQPLKIKRNRIRMLIEIFLERLAYSFSKLILTVSKDEKSLLVNYGIKAEKIAIVPNGVDTLIFKPSSVNLTKNKTSTKFRIIFVGNMEYSPNQQAVQVISSIIAPDVCKKMRNVEFVIVGRVPSQLRFKHSNLKFVGVVDDVAKELEKSHIAIAPILKGSGTRLKILEYFSCGLPVISTKIGAEGLDVENGVHIIIEDDIENFADKIMLLLNNKNLARKIGKAARKLVVTKYDWQSIVKKLNKIYLSILAQRCLGKR